MFRMNSCSRAMPTADSKESSHAPMRRFSFQTPVLFFVPPQRSYPLETAFVQDEISLVNDRVKLQIGSKFENNDFSGFEVQPMLLNGCASAPAIPILENSSRSILDT